MSHTVIGIFDSISEAQNAVEQLISNGFMRDKIDISRQGTSETRSQFNTEDNDHHSSFFGSLFDDKDEASNYSKVAKGGTIVTVHAQSQQEAEQAADIIDQYGMVDGNNRDRQYSNSTSADTLSNATRDSDTTSIPIIEEQMHVGKQEVETGGLRLRSRIIERPVEEHLRLREEHVHVERESVNRPVSGADLDNFKEATIELTEHAEVAVVSKEARVVEEISVSKEVEEREEVITDTLRSTDVEVEDLSTSQSQQNFTNRHVGEDTAFLDQSHQDWQNALVRMEKVEDEYEVAEDDPDVRGWEVISGDGEKIGEVDELIVDTTAMKVRYLDVELEDDLLDTDDRHILIPIGSATLDRDNNNVMVSYLDSGSLANFPSYNGASISREYEHKIMAALSPNYQAGSVTNDKFYEGEHFSTDRFSGSKRF